ncbi:type II toxin-antitoxin system HipA family toxin [Methylophaga muralis]|uniref:Serine/threonine-protein kinase HipA n=1 Tax=Methylophaga muralis TaxID=291169 RepID=A0A1E3GPJ2_9GAMM|nr:type II toxin-antitoxin system HipA family toxin [Methylophaga muralis]ODN65973.1 Serine/threonine-protein kinase HipA [Methylophaga muralis]
MSASDQVNEIQVLELSLHDELVGYLAGLQNGRNVLTFADSFRHNPNRSTFSLITHPTFPTVEKILSEPWVKHQRLHPTLSNLLPEGALRELITQNKKIHIDDEFHLFSTLGHDLPGAIVAKPMDPDRVPESILNTHGQAKAIGFKAEEGDNKFSLAGVQIKFSMKERDGRYNLTKGGELGDWIIKTPSTKHKNVPLNEFTAMSLAKLVGVDIPEIKLVELNKLDNLPQIKLPDENHAFAIKRFDRNAEQRIHMEDFAQILVKYPHEKYNSANYEQLGRIIYGFSGDGMADVQQFARRLLINILLANGDAHLKNWSLYYPDKKTPRLSPAYDIVTTNVYMDDEVKFALNLGKTKEWYNVSLSHFELWATKSGVPWRAIKSHLDDVMEKARALWPQALNDLPMDDEHKVKLREHWTALHEDFKIHS